MKDIKTRLTNIDWSMMTAHVHEKGFAIIPSILSSQECAELIDAYDDNNRYRKTINMERYRFGAGEYKYFKYPLPEIIQTIREEIYTRLVAVANNWMQQLKIEKKFPATFIQMQDLCKTGDQVHPAVLILKYGKGG